MSEWRPIKTAPEDGTMVLVCDGRHIWISARMIGKFAGPSVRGMPTTGHDWYIDFGAQHPTHWQQLPPPPKA